MLETMTRGNSSKKIEPTTLPIATAAAAKADPSERDSASQAAAITASRASASMGLGTKPSLSPRWLQVSQPKDTAVASQPSRPDSRPPFPQFADGLEGEVGGPQEQAEHGESDSGEQSERDQQPDRRCRCSRPRS